VHTTIIEEIGEKSTQKNKPGKDKNVI